MAEGSKIYKIGEVSRITGVKAFVLRYWETEFPMLRPPVANGQRRYREQDIATVLEIKRLLYDEGFTIAGARKHLKEGKGGAAGATRTSAEPRAAGAAKALPANSAKALRQAREELRAILRVLEEA